ncbi:hypothetical protein KUTeg_012773 [Tegillarca granosa]|uniref:Methyltransferase type 11 domain-containing protein n=1 Tax=Tegillarca granosa TaxID=220873 RepID=A0ABQ9F0L2_TEGGR|nr:hypothetical protein KUTeg_012773 [Tegillarca granosa]
MTYYLVDGQRKFVSFQEYFNNFVEYQPLASNGETGNINKISTDTVEGNAGKALKPVSITTTKLIIDSIRQSVFQNIYKHKLWGKGGKGSGGGSSVGYTVILRKRLLEFITKHNFSSMADIPCGAMEWTEVFLKSVWQERPFFRYIGMDITKSVVEQLQEQWKGNDKVNIRLADLVSPLPNIKADFILTRDALQHIPLKDACLAIENIINLGDNVKYVLIGTYPKNLRNTNIKTGGYQSINVIKDPFNLPEPYLTIKEIPDKEQKYANGVAVKAIGGDGNARVVKTVGVVV